MTPRLLDFAYLKYNDTFNITNDWFKNDADLQEKIQTGKGDEEIYKGRHFIDINKILKGPFPIEPD